MILISLEKVIFEGKARSVILPGEQGVFELSSFHRPLLSRLVGGSVFIDEKPFQIRRGLVGVNLNKATIVVEE